MGEGPGGRDSTARDSETFGNTAPVSAPEIGARCIDDCWTNDDAEAAAFLDGSDEAHILEQQDMHVDGETHLNGVAA